MPKIGAEFGGRDHSTVIHAHEKILEMLKDDQTLQQDVQDIHNVFLVEDRLVDNMNKLVHTYEQVMHMWKTLIVRKEK